MPDQFKNFNELKQTYRDGIDYRIRAGFRSEAAIILAIHAGGIEMGTSELAQAIAGDDFSFYLLEGLIGNSQLLHITSTNFDEPDCLALVQRHRVALSLHGFADLPGDPLIYLGGKDRVLVRRLLEALEAGGYPSQINTGKFAATDPDNICNRTGTGQGVQLELSARLRSQFFENYLTYRGRQTITSQFWHFVRLIRQSLLEA